MVVRVVCRFLLLCLFTLLTSAFTVAQSAPQITEVLPTAKAHGGDTITIRGTNFGSSQGSGVLKICGSNPLPVSSWSDTEIVTTVPFNAGAPTWGVQVTQNSLISNQFPYEIVKPAIASITPRQPGQALLSQSRERICARHRRLATGS